MTAGAAMAPGRAAPGLARRLACLVYEGVLLFGVVMAAGLVYAGLTGQRHALQGQSGLQVFVFIVLGIYFAWFWSHGRQTLAMKTWHMRLLTKAGAPVPTPRALARYLLSWIWFLPALAAVRFWGLKGGWPTAGAVLAGLLVYALLTGLHPRRQYWHDALCGTQLVDCRPAPPA